LSTSALGATSKRSRKKTVLSPVPSSKLSRVVSSSTSVYEASCQHRWLKCVVFATWHHTSVRNSKPRSSNSIRTATTLCCPAALGWNRLSPKPARTSCRLCRRVKSVPASSHRSSTSVRSSTWAASTVWYTFPNCPGSTSTTHQRLSKLARKSL